MNGGKWEYFFIFLQDWIEFRSLISLEISSMIEKEYIREFMDNLSTLYTEIYGMQKDMKCPKL